MDREDVEMKVYKVKKNDEVNFIVNLTYSNDFIEAVANKVIEIAEKKKKNKEFNEVLRDLMYGE